MGQFEDQGIARRRFLSKSTAVAIPVVLSQTAHRTEASRAIRQEDAGLLDVRSLGATGDGRTDDTEAIQAAIDTVAPGGGSIAFPPGTYSTRTLTIPSRVHLIGSGFDATILRLHPGTDDDLIRSDRFADRTGSNDPEGPFNWSIRDLTIDGNRAENRRGCGLRVYGYGYLLRDLLVRSCPEAGIYSEWSTAGMASLGDSMEAQYLNLKVHDCGAGGIVFRGPHDSLFVNCIVYHGTTSGIAVEQSDRYTATGSQFVNCHVWGNHVHAWRIASSPITLVNCVGEWATSAQMLIADNDATIVASRFFGNPGDRHVGIEIGLPDRVVYGTQIDARMSDLLGGALKFTNEGGSSKIKALIYQTGGIAVAGSPASSTLLELAVHGIEDGSETVFPRGPLTWNGGTAIRRHLSGTASWEPDALAPGQTTWTTLEVTGASVGDTVAVGFSQPVPGGAFLVGSVTEPGTVTVSLLNQTGGPLRLPVGTLRADCWVH